MKRRSHRRITPARLQRWGRAAFVLFLLFVAYRILTPTSREVVRVASPDGSKTARLRKIYYTREPSYKVDFREEGKLLWLNLLYLPAYTNAPVAGRREVLDWSRDSRRLSFRIDDRLVWSHAFPRSPQE